jgi:alpha-tubulin suppressor-like RCC1 family protein
MRVPVQVTGLTSVTAIAAGGGTAYALRSDGTVWAWGDNGVGELGMDDDPYHGVLGSNVPLQVVQLTGVVAIAAGGLNGYALLPDGTVRSWGFNIVGQLGNGQSVNDARVPVAVSGLTGVTAIAAGGSSAYAVLADGHVRAWGSGEFGELGNGALKNKATPVQVSGLIGVTAIVGGLASAYALRSDGYVWAWGYNISGQLGNGDTTTSDSPIEVSGLSGVIGIGDGPASHSGYAIEPG